MKYDYLIVGAGLAGATFAQQARANGKSVLVLEKRNHVAGNAYTENLECIDIHRYGPHIFHTNNREVWEYVNRFALFNNFVNSPKANYRGETYSLPFNMHTFNEMWGVRDSAEAQRIINEQRSEINNKADNLEEQAISLVGKDIYEKLIRGYTEKQWGRSCRDLPASIIKRIPVRFTFDNNYFDSDYQGIPVCGYTQMVENMLCGIDVRLRTDYLAHKSDYDVMADKIIYTGPIDAFYGYRFGYLEYRSLRFESQILDMPDFQNNAVVNYTDSETPWTRIIEHKWFTFGKDRQENDIKRTIITKEYSHEWVPGKEPYYPVNDEKNIGLYTQYKDLADAEPKTVFTGRLAEYKYCDMDEAIASVLRLCKSEF